MRFEEKRHSDFNKMKGANRLIVETAMPHGADATADVLGIHSRKRRADPSLSAVEPFAEVP